MRGGRSLRKSAAAVALVAGLLGATATQASGYVVLTPGSHDFGSQQVGTIGAPFDFNIKVYCNANPVMMTVCDDPGDEDYDTDAAMLTGDFVRSGGSCSGTVIATVNGTSCTYGVAFAATGLGSRSGKFQTSGDFSTLTGTGVLTAPIPPVTVTPTPLVTAPLSTPAPGAKKCRKGKGRAAASKKKRCKKRK